MLLSRDWNMLAPKKANSLPFVKLSRMYVFRCGFHLVFYSFRASNRRFLYSPSRLKPQSISIVSFLKRVSTWMWFIPLAHKSKYFFRFRLSLLKLLARRDRQRLQNGKDLGFDCHWSFIAGHRLQRSKFGDKLWFPSHTPQLRPPHRKDWKGGSQGLGRHLLHQIWRAICAQVSTRLLRPQRSNSVAHVIKEAGGVVPEWMLQLPKKKQPKFSWDTKTSKKSHDSKDDPPKPSEI